MKKLALPLVVVALMVTTYACKSKTDAASDKAAESAAPATEAKPESNNAAETKTYSVTVTPDSAALGKNKEALLKITNVKATQLNDPDGKSTGIELSYDLELTNRNDLKGDNVFINPSDFRLVLDNGTKITHDNYNSVAADAQSTKTSVDNKFKLPAGTKPVALNLFFSETSAQVKLELK